MLWNRPDRKPAYLFWINEGYLGGWVAEFSAHLVKLTYWNDQVQLELWTYFAQGWWVDWGFKSRLHLVGRQMEDLRLMFLCNMCRYILICCLWPLFMFGFTMLVAGHYYSCPINGLPSPTVAIFNPSATESGIAFQLFSEDMYFIPSVSSACFLILAGV